MVKSWSNLHQQHQHCQPLRPHPIINVSKPSILTWGAGGELSKAGPLPHPHSPYLGLCPWCRGKGAKWPGIPAQLAKLLSSLGAPGRPLFPCDWARAASCPPGTPCQPGPGGWCQKKDCSQGRGGSSTSETTGHGPADPGTIEQATPSVAASCPPGPGSHCLWQRQDETHPCPDRP